MSLKRALALGALVALASVGGCGGGDDAPAPPPLSCNGHEHLCDRRLDEVVFPATHNSMSNEDDGWIAPNQTHGLARQLDDGVRAFLIDTHTYEDAPQLCHAVCQFGAIKLSDALAIYRTFLDRHPSEVLALLIEDDISSANTERAFVDAGLVPYLIVHQPGEPWPTLRELISRGTRLLVTAERGGPPPAWYHHLWDLAWDTPYTYDSLAKIEATGADPNRGSPSNQLFLINHWIGDPLPSRANGALANTREALTRHVEACRARHGRLPTFLAVDFYDEGALLQVVDELNAPTR
ncbi:MAG: hypothetical protein IT374_06845 [Polyangiaceae bacterium]|nr:hypothetical protein [Polyangiaceae bacterium]